MKIIALQLDGEPENRRANMDKIAGLAARNAKDSPDVIVLPELWAVGFYPDNGLEFGDDDGKEARAVLSGLATRDGVKMVGG